ncbi:MAG: peptidoglycan editing factor PgeF [Thiogranum sp.]|nr:peptidoglycan editing factor PgeF [Thiogranum sp.]
MIVPEWPAAMHVKAVSTTRAGGVSVPPYAGLNLAGHVGDAPEAVAENRARLQQSLQLPQTPLWLNQVHGNRVVDAAAVAPGAEGDASYSSEAGVVCAVLTADCLPVLFCDRRGSRVAAAHAGWRGLAAGVLEATVAALDTAPGELMAWLGPAIGPRHFEVGDEVRHVFIDQQSAAHAAFTAGPDGRWMADLYRLARLRLQAAGVDAVYGGRFCTYAERDRFYSYRRDGVTGRMASLIWLA